MKRGLFAELRRRNVLRAGVLYIGGVWALAQGISQLGPSVGAPAAMTRWFLIVATVGFPFWIAFAWFFELTPSGVKRESDIDPADARARPNGRRLDFAIIGVLSIAVVLLLVERLAQRRVADAAAGVPEKSIAVLPFVNLSSDRDQEYFADGVSEELLNLLAKVPNLKVVARTSSFAFKGAEIGIPEIARQLRVAYVLEGSVRKAGQHVRITAQLVHAADGFHLWSDTWDRELDDIFAIQDEIAAEVVKALRVKLLGNAPRARTTDPEAYALYLQAVQLGRQFTAEAFAKSDALYRQVLATDPSYAPAWDGLSTNSVNEMSLGLLTNEEGSVRAREEVAKALEIDPESAKAHATLGWLAMVDNDLADASRHFERALAVDPSDLNVLGNAASLLQSLGRPGEALALLETVVSRDPVNVTALYNLGIAQRWAGRLDQAIASYRTVLNLSPGRGGARSGLGETLLLLGDASAALAEIEQETSEFWRMIALPMAYHALGRHTDSDEALAALIARYESDASYNIAGVYAFRGEADRAFEWLGKAVEYQDPGLSEIVVDNLFAAIHSDTRWLPFLRELGKAPEQLANIEFDVILTASDAPWSAEAATRGSARRAQLRPRGSESPRARA